MPTPTKHYDSIPLENGGVASPTAAQKEARRIVEAFYMCMP